jgi:putative hemolysin
VRRKKAKSIKKILENPSKFLATIQIGITFAGFLSSAFASEAFASELAPKLNNLIPQLSVEVWNSISIIIITIILSYFTLIFGELVPKRIAMKYSEKIAFASIKVVRVVAIVTSPFVKFLTFSTNIVSKIFGVSGDEEETVTEEEIRMMVDVGEEKGNIESQEKKMINNIFEFNDRVASEIMVHRTNIVAVNIDMTIAEVVEKMSEDTRYSRIPVYDENIDEIEDSITMFRSAKNLNQYLF